LIWRNAAAPCWWRDDQLSPLWRQKMTRSISVFVIALIFFYSFPVFWPSKKAQHAHPQFRAADELIPSQSLTIYLRAARLVIRFLISVGRKSKKNKAKMTARVTDMHLLFRAGELVKKLRARCHYTTLVHYTHTYQRSTLLFRVSAQKKRRLEWLNFPVGFPPDFTSTRDRTFWFAQFASSSHANWSNILNNIGGYNTCMIHWNESRYRS
jgi:hypothetical protein